MFDMAYDALLRKGKAEEMIQLKEMRQFVLDNENSPDPAKRQAAEDMYQHLTRIMSAQSRTSPMLAPEGPVGEGGSMGAMAGSAQPPEHPMMKAWDNLRKNVIGMQGATQYNMPPSVASMAQRQQVPEMQPSRFFGRMKPTGEMTVGERPPSRLDSEGQPVYPVQNRLGEGAVQQNPPHPMGDVMGVGEAPGAKVTRMPRPSPFPVNVADDHAMGAFQRENPSFSGRGFEEGNTGAFGQPSRIDDRTYMRVLENNPNKPDRLTNFRPLSVIPSGTYGDQFAPNMNYDQLQ